MSAEKSTYGWKGIPVMDAILTATRDPRIDVMRGMALLMIFVDHLPGNTLGWFTMHVFGFADAAEVFVLLAGFASMLAYGKVFLRSSIGVGVRRLALRCLRIYATHAGLLLATLATVQVWSNLFRVAPVAAAPLLDAGLPGLLRGLALQALPGYLDILPLYVVLLACFPVLFWAMRRSVWLALGGSAAIWLATQFDHRLNFPNWLDPGGWYFDPFAWQFLFAIGAALALYMSRLGGDLPRLPWLTALCWAFLAFAMVQTFPWGEWRLPSLRLVTMATSDKSHLDVFRILDILALMQVIFSARGSRAMARHWTARAFEACGRHSLDIFAIGCLLALLGRLVFRTFGRSWQLQLTVNLGGLVAMCLVALWLEHRAARRRQVGAAHATPRAMVSRALQPRG